MNFELIIITIVSDISGWAHRVVAFKIQIHIVKTWNRIRGFNFGIAKNCNLWDLNEILDGYWSSFENEWQWSFFQRFNWTYSVIIIYDGEWVSKENREKGMYDQLLLEMIWKKRERISVINPQHFMVITSHSCHFKWKWLACARNFFLVSSAGGNSDPMFNVINV